MNIPIHIMLDSKIDSQICKGNIPYIPLSPIKWPLSDLPQIGSEVIIRDMISFQEYENLKLEMLQTECPISFIFSVKKIAYANDKSGVFQPIIILQSI